VQRWTSHRLRGYYIRTPLALIRFDFIRELGSLNFKLVQSTRGNCRDFDQDDCISSLLQRNFVSFERFEASNRATPRETNSNSSRSRYCSRTKAVWISQLPFEGASRAAPNRASRTTLLTKPGKVCSHLDRTWPGQALLAAGKGRILSHIMY